MPARRRKPSRDAAPRKSANPQGRLPGQPVVRADPALAMISERRLGTTVAKACGITRQAISLWRQVPWNRVLTVSAVTGWPPHLIRPDIYPAPERAAEPRVPVPSRESKVTVA